MSAIPALPGGSAVPWCHLLPNGFRQARMESLSTVAFQLLMSCRNPFIIGGLLSPPMLLTGSSLPGVLLTPMKITTHKRAKPWRKKCPCLGSSDDSYTLYANKLSRMWRDWYVPLCPRQAPLTLFIRAKGHVANRGLFVCCNVAYTAHAHVFIT